MSQHTQILAEYGYRQRSTLRSRQADGIRSDGLPYAGRAKVSEEKQKSRRDARAIEDYQLARELGLSVAEVRGR